MGPKRLWVVLLLSVLCLEAGWSNGCLDQERDALLQLKHFFTHLPHVDDGSDCCKWEWVDCNTTTRRVTKLSLNHTNWRGDAKDTRYLNTSLFLPFEELRSLYLHHNQIAGCLENEGFGKLSKLNQLEILDLSYNFFNNSVLTDLSGFSNLKSLDIRFNNLKGSIDIKEFCHLYNLESLDMSYNGVNHFVTSKEKRCLKKLKVLYLDGVSTKHDISLVSLIEPFSSVKTLSLRDNSYLNETVVTQELHVLGNLEDLLLDNTHVNINFLQRIGILTSLKTLSLYNCSLAGTLPSQGWCYIKSLEELRVNGNALEGDIDSCLGNLTFLRYLDISDNQFTGNIASTPLTNLTMLQYLSLANNQFEIPVSFNSFANHSDLKFLFCDGNKFVAEPGFNILSPNFQLKVFSLSNRDQIEEHRKLQFPKFLYYQNDLIYLDLSNINFGGIGFPNWLLENNTKLEALYMIDSSIVGPLFLPSHPSSNLKVLDISNNRVQRQIPMDFCSFFPNLEGLFMSRNAFESNIPLCLGDMRYLTHLDMSQNRLFGGIPVELSQSPSLQFLRLSNNFLSGKMFPAKFRSDTLEGLYLDGNNFDADLPSFSPISSSVLKILDLSDNHLSGKLPIWLWNYTNLMRLTMANNQFQGPIPIELCNMVNLEFMILSYNHLSGNIPPCSLQNIKHVHLRRNKLSGPLSHAFYRSTSLETLDLSNNNFTGKIPDWNGTLPALSVLVLRANQFHGELTENLCKLYSLRILDLSQNKLSGSLPSCLMNSTDFHPWVQRFDTSTFIFRFKIFDRVLADMGQKIHGLITIEDDYSANGFPTSRLHRLNYLEEYIQVSIQGETYSYGGSILDFLSGIDLSCNRFTGMIPPGLGNLSKVRILNLSQNSLTGPIPSTFSKFDEIESLDLSFNKLNGIIPPQLATWLTFLSFFSVAHNNLSGHIPNGGQFGTFEESSYEGNPLLCGPPSNRSCGTEGD